jgi:formylmethanofuran dehydrogenase subunit C
MLKITLRTSLTVPLEAECIRPDTLCHLKPAEILQQPVWYGNREEKLGIFLTCKGTGKMEKFISREICPK